MSITLGLPDVYVQPRPRVPAPRRVRSDVAGLVGFEPRIRPAEASLATAPPSHRVSVALAPIQLRIDEQRVRLAVPASAELALSEGAVAPVGPSQAIVYAIVATLPEVARSDSDRRLPEAQPFAVSGTAVAGAPAPPTDAAVDAVLAAAVTAGELDALRTWTRLADAYLRREGDVLWLTVHPRTGPAACEDWRDFLLQFGPPAEDGTRLAAAVRAFFANGGDRCHVTTVRRPLSEDDVELQTAREDMVGIADAGIARATGVARLVLIEEVALVAAPDLHAQRPGAEETEVPLPPSEADADFRRCAPPEPPPQPATGSVTFDEPLYGDLDILFDTERRMLDLVARVGLGVELILTPPLHPDAATGHYGPPDAAAAMAWRARFLVADPEARDLAFAACYWPWLQTQERPGAPVRDEPPLGAVLGIIARRDLQRGPFVAPANEDVRGVIGPSHRIGDEEHRRLYDPSADAGRLVGGAVNVMRPFPTRGIELWGSRTLAADRCLRHLPIRRGLSAIERQASAALADVVFEPNSPILALRVTNMMVVLLLGLFEAGALRGTSTEEAFAVRCDEGVNPPESVAEGRFVCEVSVALAAPSEFIVFRLGRQDGAIEVQEP